jgi:hypothetical protein
MQKSKFISKVNSFISIFDTLKMQKMCNGSTAVENLPHDAEVKSLSPAIAVTDT